ncbi:MAG: hypothetical protein JWP63_4667 [Candidatus Solibacter sp.]|nr:hypothetical protein [Candidatus Solibacter sp.]
MRQTLVSRLERLESMPGAGRPQFFRYGWLRPLPADYGGERHVAIVSREPTLNPLVEWCVFEERPGKSPGSVVATR